MSDDLDAAQRQLNATRAKARRQKAGPALDQSSADLDALSEVGPQNLGELEAFIRDAAGQAGVDMLRATRAD